MLLCLVPFWVQLVTGCDNLCKLHCFNIFTGVFVKIFCIWNIITGLYQVAHQCGHFPASMLKLKRDKCELNQKPIQSAPPIDEYTTGIQTRPTLVLDDNSPLLTPLTTEEYTLKAVFQPTKQLKYAEDITSEGETPVSQVTPLLGTTPSETNQIQHRNTPDNISNILGTRVYQGYVETPLQTLDGIIVNQPKWFLPLAEEAKCIAEEIRIEKINEQWTGIPYEQLLNQSFTEQLNSIQILEQLAPLQLAKENLPGDIIDILERLGKADNILFNQLYYIAENCADRYYSKVIETFISILKHQFADRQLLLVNMAQSLKFLEEYADHQAQIWKIFQKHQTIPEDFQDLHLHFNPDIDDVPPTTIDQELNNLLIQGTASPTPKTIEPEIEHITPAPSHQYTALQETDWPDAIPVEIPSHIDQPNDQRIDIQWTPRNSEPVKIPQLEENLEEEQYPRLLLNTSQYI